MEPCAANRPAVLIIGSIGENSGQLLRMLGACNCDTQAAGTRQAALAIMRERIIPIAICDHELPDGTWTDLLNELSTLADRPNLVVTSRTADDHLWVEVLNMGGYDVLSQPFVHREVAHVIDSAWRNWTQQQLQRIRIMKAGSSKKGR
jgi:DNA-binding response OmpR family regulator